MEKWKIRPQVLEGYAARRGWPASSAAGGAWIACGLWWLCWMSCIMTLSAIPRLLLVFMSLHDRAGAMRGSRRRNALRSLSSNRERN